MIVGTAGHIDHGKTSLVKALTGVDADRLKEEKERGITVDLGFAYQAQADGQVLGFVDVPGHEKLVRNMLAGATGIDHVNMGFAIIVSRYLLRVSVISHPRMFTGSVVSWINWDLERTGVGSPRGVGLV
ncbi:MAG: GTP-binding protein, partial [Betaproteobacteria bacterium]